MKIGITGFNPTFREELLTGFTGVGSNVLLHYSDVNTNLKFRMVRGTDLNYYKLLETMSRLELREILYELQDELKKDKVILGDIEAHFIDLERIDRIQNIHQSNIEAMMMYGKHTYTNVLNRLNKNGVLSDDDYYDYIDSFEIKNNSITSFRMFLKRMQGIIDITSLPGNVEIILDGCSLAQILLISYYFGKQQDYKVILIEGRKSLSDEHVLKVTDNIRESGLIVILNDMFHLEEDTVIKVRRSLEEYIYFRHSDGKSATIIQDHLRTIKVAIPTTSITQPLASGFGIFGHRNATTTTTISTPPKDEPLYNKEWIMTMDGAILESHGRTDYLDVNLGGMLCQQVQLLLSLI